MSNSTATNLAPTGPARPSEPPAAPIVFPSGVMTKARPPPIEEGLMFVMEKEKKVEKLAGE